MKMSSFLPPIRIHTWGGYGSQLYGVYLTYVLKQRFPYRNSIVIVHTSGVTERNSEIQKYKEILSIEVRDFYVPSQVSIDTLENFRQTRLPNLKALIKKVFLSLGFLSESNTQGEFLAIKPWVLTMRGHYTRIPFETKSLQLLFDLINRNLKVKSTDHDAIGIQYRLGDLVNLENKFPTSPDSILKCIKKISTEENSGIHIFSDSLPLAMDLLRPLIPKSIHVQGIEAGPDEALIALSQMHFFIGTTAKLSVWVAAFRSLLLSRSNTYMQSSFEAELKSHGINSSIEYY